LLVAELETTAAHEAGHAIAAATFGWPIVEVSARPAYSKAGVLIRLGNCEYRPTRPEDRTAADYHALAILELSGPAAALLLTGERDPSAPADVAKARQWLKHLGTSSADVDSLLAITERMAADLVEHQAGPLTILFNSLQQRGRISGLDLKTLETLLCEVERVVPADLVRRPVIPIR